MTDLEFLESLRQMWRERHTAANQRRADAERDRALAASELDALDEQIAQLRLDEAESNLTTGASA